MASVHRIAVASIWICLLSSASAMADSHFFAATYGADEVGCGTRAEPCRYISYTQNQSSAGGTITLLDEGDFGSFSEFLVRRYTIQGQGPGSRITENPAGDESIFLSNAGASYVLRNLTIGGDASKVGINIVNVGSLTLENVAINNDVETPAVGIYLHPSAASTLSLRNVTIETTGTGSTGGAVVIAPTSAAVSRVDITDSLLTRNARGVVVQGASNVQLSINNTTIANSNGDGILVNPGGGTTRLVIQASKVVNNAGTGVLIAPTGSARVTTTVMGSGMDSNVIGIRSFPGGSAVSNVTISDSSTSNNGGGIHASGKSVVSIIRGAIGGNSSYGVGAISPAAVRIGSSVVSGNTLGFSGPISSYGNNQLHGNTNPGSSSPIPPGSVP